MESKSTKSPLARLVLFMICLAVAGAIAAGLYCYLEHQQSQVLNSNAPTNDIVMTGGEPGPASTPFHFAQLCLWVAQ